MAKRALARFGILVLLVISLLAACSQASQSNAPKASGTTAVPSPSVASKPSPAASTGSATAAPAASAGAATAVPAAPRPEKIVVLTQSFGLEGFLPDNDSFVAFKVLPNYETLWDMDPATRELRPMLAETLPQWSDDGKTLTINLRQGVQFHDNWGEMTAEDMKYSIELGGKTGSKNTGQSDFAKASVEVLGPYKLAVHLPRPDWAWALNNATLARPALVVVSKKHIEKVGAAEAARHPIGTGPFKLIDHKVGDSITFEAVPNHWRKTPEFKTLVIKLIAEPATMIAMLRSGEADIAAIPPSFVPEAKAASLEIRLNQNTGVIGVGLGGQYLASKDTFDPKVPWVGDPKDAGSLDRALKVRQALNLAVNRAEIIDKVLNGIGGPWPIVASPNVGASYDASMKPYAYDVSQATQLLSQAGYPSGFPVNMIEYPQAGHATVEVAEAVATYWEKIGLKVTRQQMDNATFRTRQLGRKNSGLAFGTYRVFSDAEMIGALSYFSSKGTGMQLMFEYPETDALIDKATAEMNPQKRADLEREFHKKIYDGYYAVPISLEHATLAVNSKRIGEWATLTGDLYPGRFEYIKLR